MTSERGGVAFRHAKSRVSHTGVTAKCWAGDGIEQPIVKSPTSLAWWVNIGRNHFGKVDSCDSCSIPNISKANLSLVTGKML